MTEKEKINIVGILVTTMFLIVNLFPASREAFWSGFWAESHDPHGLFGAYVVILLGWFSWSMYITIKLTKPIYRWIRAVAWWAIQSFLIIPIFGYLELKKLAKNPYWNWSKATREDLYREVFYRYKYLDFAGDGHGQWQASKRDVPFPT